MRPKWPKTCWIRRPGCLRSLDYLAIITMPSGEEAMGEICFHCLALLIVEGKIVDKEALCTRSG